MFFLLPKNIFKSVNDTSKFNFHYGSNSDNFEYRMVINLKTNLIHKYYYDW